MSLFKSKKPSIDRMKVEDIETQIENIEKRKILLTAETKKEQIVINKLKEEGKGKSPEARRPLAYRILRTDNNMKHKLKEIESLEREILGLDNLKNLLVSRNENASRNSSIMNADIDSIKQEAMKDRIKREEYDKKLQELSELSDLTGDTDSGMIDEYAKSLWDSEPENEPESEEEIERRIDRAIKEESDRENSGVDSN